MPSDWENREKADADRRLRLGFLAGVIWTAVGVVGLAVVLVIGRPDLLAAGIFTAAIGLLTLLSIAVARRRTE